jgi:hypothetical protein
MKIGNEPHHLEQIKTTRLNASLFAVPVGFREFTGSYDAPEFVTPVKPDKK